MGAIVSLARIDPVTNNIQNWRFAEMPMQFKIELNNSFV